MRNTTLQLPPIDDVTIIVSSLGVVQLKHLGGAIVTDIVNLELITRKAQEAVWKLRLVNEDSLADKKKLELFPSK